jgi:adenylate cyclase
MNESHAQKLLRLGLGRKESWAMAHILTEDEETSQLNKPRGSQPALAMSSATLRYHSAGEDHYFPLSRLSVCTIGRNNANNICLDDRLVSRDHATIRCTASGQCELTDLGSSNGTRVNGKTIEGLVVLRDGDTIQLGQHAIDFIQSGQRNDLVSQSGDDAMVSVFPPNSLITALSLNLRGYLSLMQILGETQLARLMDDIGQIAEDIFARHHVWKTHRNGSAVNAVWAHHDDQLPANNLLSILDAVAEIRIGVRPLQKRYHLLRPIEFGGGLTNGHAQVANYDDNGNGEFGSLCEVLQQAYQLELATRATGCDMLVSESIFERLTPAAAPEHVPAVCSVSLKTIPGIIRSHALHFDRLGDLSGALVSPQGA